MIPKLLELGKTLNCKASIKESNPKQRPPTKEFLKNNSRMQVPLLLILTISFLNICAATHDQKLPSAMVVGAVYCDTCFLQQFSKTSHFISGASVEIKCGDLGHKTGFREEVKTDKHGMFKVHLPFTISKHIKKIKKCSVKLVDSSEPFCALASMASSSSLQLKSRRQGIHIFSAGFFTFKPLQPLDLCYEKPSSSSPSSLKTFIPYPDIPPFPPLIQNTHLPPLPQLPPQLPTLPTLPPLPNFGSTPPEQPSLKTVLLAVSSTPPSSLQEPAQPNFLDPKLPPAFGIPSPPNPLQLPPPFIIPPPLPIITNPQPSSPIPFPPFSFPIQPPAFPGTPPSKKNIP